MCGRFAIDGKVNEAISECVHAGGKPEDWRPSGWATNYNVAPTNPSVIVRDRVDDNAGEIRREVDWDAIWDFRPPWLKTPAPQINAASITTYTASKAINNVRARPKWDDVALLEPVELDAPADRLSSK